MGVEQSVSTENREHGISVFTDYAKRLLGKDLREPEHFSCVHGDIIRIKDPDLYDLLLTAAKVSPKRFADNSGYWYDPADDTFRNEPSLSIEIDGLAGILFMQKYGLKYNLEKE